MCMADKRLRKIQYFSVQYDRLSDQEVEMNYFVGGLALILAHILCTDAKIQGSARIIGGRPMDIGKLPFAALITRQGKIHCGATVIAERFLLTAAHCVEGYELGELRAFMGHAAMKNIDKAIIHIHYNDETYDHDIALLQLESPVEFGVTIAPVCLPLDKRDPTGKKGTVVGWGDTSEDGNPSSMPRHANVTIYTKRQCKNMRYESHTISKNMICAGTPTADTCQGDSGGSLMVLHDHKYEIVGVTSWGKGCGRRGYPGVYTRITKYVTWICDQLEEHMNNECLCQKNTTKTCQACGQSSLIQDYDDESQEESEETTNENNSSEEETSSDERTQSDEGRASETTSGFWLSLKQVFELFDP